MFVVNNEAAVDISIVCEVEVCVLKEVVVDLVPGVFDEGDGDIAQGWRELGANPSPSDLFVGVVASPENACVEGKCHDSGDVGGLDSALCRVFSVVSAYVRVVKRVASGLDIHCEGVCGLLLLPVVNERVDCINESVLRDRVEKADQVIVGGIQGDVCRGLGEWVKGRPVCVEGDAGVPRWGSVK